MNRTIAILSLAATIPGSQALSETSTVKLSDYAFDFPAYGYEIAVSGTTQNFSDKLGADDYINIRDDGYTIKTLIDRMARKDRQQFITFFNENCIGFLEAECSITATGDVELDEDMKMIFRMDTATINKDENEWSNLRSE